VNKQISLYLFFPKFQTLSRFFVNKTAVRNGKKIGKEFKTLCVMAIESMLYKSSAVAEMDDRMATIAMG